MSPAASERGVELRGLQKTYRSPAGPVHAVRGIDVLVQRGETVALLGPNGAGKSTTVDLLLGLQAPDAGSVAVFGGPPERACRPAASAQCFRPAASSATSPSESSSR